MYLNRVTFISFSATTSDKKVVGTTSLTIFSVATKMCCQDDSGTSESRSEWHHCVAFNKPADFAGALKKSAHMAIQGKLRGHEYGRERA